jgi:phosphoenolpyruvate carboxykinase (ATP)
VIACDLTNGEILIAGTFYAGEMKKSVFTALNYLLPAKGVMPMHCSANVGPDGDAAVFFGLSGTGKTTLSADPARTLIGDDEHGWGEDGIFNFEGGCYAKTIRLSPEAEPEIYATTQRFGTVLENVVLNLDREPDFNDGSLTENTRCAYPLDFIPNASKPVWPATEDDHHADRRCLRRHAADRQADAGSGDVPLPLRLHRQGRRHGAWRDRAGSHLLDLLRRSLHAAASVGIRQSAEGLIGRHGVECWLVNTGWTGGAYGTGKRMPIKATRTLLAAALSGELNKADFRADSNFGFAVPVAVAGVETGYPRPALDLAGCRAYDAQATKLVDHVHRQLRQVRRARRWRGARCGPGFSGRR